MSDDTTRNAEDIAARSLRDHFGERAEEDWDFGPEAAAVIDALGIEQIGLFASSGVLMESDWSARPGDVPVFRLRGLET